MFRKHINIFVATLTLMFTGIPEARSQESRSARQTPIVKVFRDCKDAVVSISTTVSVHVRPRVGGFFMDQFFDMPPQQMEAHSLGSGFLIHSDGYLVTNAHVVDQATECKVTFADGTELSAEPVAVEPKYDLAVLKVDAKKPLPHLNMGRSDDLMPGETVIAIGNPLGYQHTVTSGIISALNRELRFQEGVEYKGLIQTDASINRGNSGGPLLNVLGELIGINSAIRGDAQNIGFAIPIDRLRELLPEMLSIERIRHFELGAHFEGKPPFGKTRGVRVSLVDANSPAAKSGLKAGDVVVSVDGHATPDFVDAFGILNKAVPSKSVRFEVVRDGAKHVNVDVKMVEVKREGTIQTMVAKFGIEVRTLRPADLRRLGLRRPVGLLVTDVKGDYPAARLRNSVQDGDIITMFGGWPVTSLSTLGHLLQQVNKGDAIPLQVLRIESGGNFYRIDMALPAR